MGTKTNPGKYDCLAKAEPDEPVFVLLGRDPIAPFLVAIWARIHHQLNQGREEHADDKHREALECADAMIDWAAKLDKHVDMAKVSEMLELEGF